MDEVLRAIAIYAVLLVIFRLSGKRSMATGRAVPRGLQRRRALEIRGSPAVTRFASFTARATACPGS